MITLSHFFCSVNKSQQVTQANRLTMEVSLSTLTYIIKWKNHINSIYIFNIELKKKTFKMKCMQLIEWSEISVINYVAMWEIDYCQVYLKQRGQMQLITTNYSEVIYQINNV